LDYGTFKIQHFESPSNNNVPLKPLLVIKEHPLNHLNEVIPKPDYFEQPLSLKFTCFKGIAQAAYRDVLSGDVQEAGCFPIPAQSTSLPLYRRLGKMVEAYLGPGAFPQKANIFTNPSRAGVYKTISPYPTRNYKIMDKY
jgi:hypothetical protein